MDRCRRCILKNNSDSGDSGFERIQSCILGFFVDWLLIQAALHWVEFVDRVVVLGSLEVGADLADEGCAVTFGNVQLLSLGDAILLTEQNKSC